VSHPKKKLSGQKKVHEKINVSHHKEKLPAKIGGGHEVPEVVDPDVLL